MIGEHWLTLFTYLSVCTGSTCGLKFWSCCNGGLATYGHRRVLHFDAGGKWQSKWSSEGLERKRCNLWIVCVYQLLECVELGPDGVLREDWLSLTLSFFLSLFFLSFFHLLFSLFFASLFFFNFLYLSPFLFFLFYLLFFLEQARVDTFLKQWYSLVWLELAARCSVISPHTWTFVWNGRGLLSSVFQHQRSSMYTIDAAPMFSSIVHPRLFLILTWNG